MRRILMALDASAASLTAVEAAATLAARMEAELLGLFVEDVNLLRLATLPFAREVGFSPAATRRLDRAGMERALRAQASRAEATLLEAAGRLHVRCSFRVVRGEVTAQLLAAAQDIDLVALGITRERFHRRGSVARAIFDAAPGSVLLLPPSAAIDLPVVTIYDGSPASARAVATARLLTLGQGGYLTVLTAGSSPDMKTKVAKLLEGSGLVVRHRPLAGTDIADVIRHARQEAAGTLVLGADLCRGEGTLEKLLEQLDCTVLLVR
jgi:nucleotide-binding universal stress UspA family protein